MSQQSSLYLTVLFMIILNYIKEVYSGNKTMFYALLFFSFLQLFFIYKGVETFPFLNYGMYSEVHTEVKQCKKVKIWINNQPFDFDNNSCINQSFLANNISYYHQLQQNNFNDPINDVIEKRFGDNKYIKSKLANNVSNDFIYWLKRYLNNKTNIDINNVKVMIGDIILIDE